MKKYLLQLDKQEIGILKAALYYYLMSNDFGYERWCIGGGSIGSKDSWERRMVNSIYEQLHAQSKVKPDFGCWGDFKFIGDFLKKEIAKWQAENDELEEKYGLPLYQLPIGNDEELKKIEKEHLKLKRQENRK